MRHKKVLLITICFFMIWDSYLKAQTEQTVTDIDGNVYHTVTIGTQVWMVENLKTTRYRNGDSIPNVAYWVRWYRFTGAYCNYYNDVNNANTYGRLYNWYAVNDSRNLAPVGWHVSTDAEWKTLISFLGGEKAAGGKLKEAGRIHYVSFQHGTDTLHWMGNNKGATNESGFTALPGGFRNWDGKFYKIKEEGVWWTATADSAKNAYFYSLLNLAKRVQRGTDDKGNGFSVRCVKDSKTEKDSVTDIDGNMYHTVTFGKQIWMVENLKTTRYLNGDMIPNVTDTAKWRISSTGAYCSYNNDMKNASTHGNLYNWYAMMDNRQIAPKGWHIPTKAEWESLIIYLRKTDYSGSDEARFSILPGGFRSDNGMFNGFRLNCNWWVLTESSDPIILFISTSNALAPASFYESRKNVGYSIRCIKD